MSQRQRSWARRHDGVIIAVLALLAVSGVLAYNQWAASRDDATQGRITRAASTCDQVDRLYRAVIRLMFDDPGIPVEDAARMQRQRVDRLGAQGCDS